MLSEIKDDIIAELLDLIGLGRSLIASEEKLAHPWGSLRRFRSRFDHYARVIFDELPQELRGLEFERFLAYDEITEEDSLSAYACDGYSEGIPGKIDFDCIAIQKAIRWVRVMVDRRRGAIALSSSPPRIETTRRLRKAGVSKDPVRSDLVRTIVDLWEEDMSVFDVCKKLDTRNISLPPRARWKSATWTKAYLDNPAVKTWFSKIKSSRKAQNTVTQLP